MKTYIALIVLFVLVYSLIWIGKNCTYTDESVTEENGTWTYRLSNLECHKR